MNRSRILNRSLTIAGYALMVAGFIVVCTLREGFLASGSGAILMALGAAALTATLFVIDEKG